ncbi:MAG TPA: hypothetical protein VF483_04200 [Gemmatimonadaceae bacterium]
MSQQLAGFIVLVVIIGSLVMYFRARRRGHGTGGNASSSWLPIDSGEAGSHGHHGHHHHGDAGHDGHDGGGHDAGGFDGGGGGHH